MTPEIWQTLGTIAALLAVGAYNAWRSIRAERAARKAVHLSTPTGNGFADDVLGRLESIEGKVDAVKTKADDTQALMVNHLAAHAAHDLTHRPPPAPPTI
jgi:hypothetical protein